MLNIIDIVGILKSKMESLPCIWKSGGAAELGFCYGTGVLVKKQHPGAVLPKQAHPGDAGFDLCAVESTTIQPGRVAMVDTGLAFAMEGNIELQIRPRSGLAAKSRITVLNSPGTVDSGYRSSVKVLLFNHGDTVFQVSPGDRIAQGVFAFLPTIHLVEVNDLPSSERGAGGFGSTGAK